MNCIKSHVSVVFKGFILNEYSRRPFNLNEGISSCIEIAIPSISFESQLLVVAQVGSQWLGSSCISHFRKRWSCTTIATQNCNCWSGVSVITSTNRFCWIHTLKPYGTTSLLRASNVIFECIGNEVIAMAE